MIKKTKFYCPNCGNRTVIIKAWLNGVWRHPHECRKCKYIFYMPKIYKGDK